jgi:hypothetical protein
MRRHKITAVLGTAALVSASVLITAAPASAATTIDNVTFYTAADFGQEGGGSYPANDWFFGEVSGAEGSASFTTQGLEFNTAADGKVQILNQNVATPATVDELIALVDDADIASDAPEPGDDWTFQLPLFAEGGAGFTTLRPATPNNIDVAVDWITSGAISDGVTTFYNAGDSAPLEDLLDAVYAGAAPTVLAYGFFVDPGAQPIIHAVRWADAVSAFTPVYAPTVTPNPITNVDLANPAKGLKLSFAGSLPGDTGYVQLSNADGDTVFENYDTPIAADGTFNFTVVANLAPGTYYLEFDDDGYAYGFLGLGQTFEVTVVAALAATGVNATVPAGIAIFTLLGGALALVFARRQKARA